MDSPTAVLPKVAKTIELQVCCALPSVMHDDSSVQSVHGPVPTEDVL